MKILTRSSEFLWRKSATDKGIAAGQPASSATIPSTPPPKPQPLNGKRKTLTPLTQRFAERFTEHLAERFSLRQKKAISPDSFQNLRPLLSYLPNKHIRQVEDAFAFAAHAHQGQIRKDGTPYIIHPLAACKILAELKLDVATLIAALLHDVVEDCDVTTQQIAERYGDKVAQIVTGVTKFKRLKDIDVHAEQAENFQKMVIAMASDLRVVLVKLADRLHNMRTLGVKSRPSQIRIAQETMDIYVPIANRMGLETIYRELQDLAFSTLFPYRAKVLRHALQHEFAKRETSLFRLRDEVMATLKQEGIRAEVQARMKNTYSIFTKMRTRHVRFNKVFDICGLRVVVEKNAQCYTCLGLMHALYKPIPGRIKDFIALPKPNGYQSLHTTLLGLGGTPIEVQIRSRHMHGVAESGLAAHWLYKDKTTDTSELEIRASQWMNSLKELNQTSANAGELMEHVKTDLFNDSVYVFTPKGKIITLPRGATALDFAYSVHTAIGHHALMANINDEELPLRTLLRNGDRISIDTHPQPTVTVASMANVKTARARSQIRHYLRHLEQGLLRELGEHWLRQILVDMAMLENDDMAHLSSTELEKKLQSVGLCGAGQCDRLFADIALGAVSPMNVGLALMKRHGVTSPAPEQFVLRSANIPSVIFSTCCYPIPDDPVEGFLKKGEGLMVHRSKCKHAIQQNHAKQNHPIKKDPPMMKVPMTWGESVDGLFATRMTVQVINLQGALANISATIAEQNCNIIGINMQPTQEHTTPIDFDVMVDNRITLGRLYKKLHGLASVKSVQRWQD